MLCAMKGKRRFHHSDCHYGTGGPPSSCNCEDFMPCQCPNTERSEYCPCLPDNKEEAKSPLERCDCGLGQYYCTSACEEIV